MTMVRVCVNTWRYLLKYPCQIRLMILSAELRVETFSFDVHIRNNHTISFLILSETFILSFISYNAISNICKILIFRKIVQYLPYPACVNFYAYYALNWVYVLVFFRSNDLTLAIFHYWQSFVEILYLSMI